MKVDPKESFFYFLSQKKYAQALLLIYKFDELSTLPEAKEVHGHFLQRLKLALVYMKKKQTNKAKELLQEFMIIEEKRVFLHLLFTYQEEFLAFVRYCYNAEVIKAYQIAQKDNRYTKLSLYTQIIEKIEKTLQRINQAIDQGIVDIDDILEEMMCYPNVKFLKKKLVITQQFINAYKKRDFVICYEMIDTYEELANNAIAQKLELEWIKFLEDSQKYIQNGAIKELLLFLKPFENIPTRKKQIQMIMKKGYRMMIQDLIKQQQYSLAEKEIYTYLELFKKDILFQDLLEEFEKKSGKTLAIPVKVQRL